MSKRDYKRDYLEFEQIDRNDLKVSKPFQTDGGDIISVVLAANGNAIITSDSKEFSKVIVENPGGIDGADTSSRGFWGGLWDKIKGAAKAVGGFIKGVLGGESSCTTVTVTTTNKNGSTTTTTTTTCTAT